MRLRQMHSEVLSLSGRSSPRDHCAWCPDHRPVLYLLKGHCRQVGPRLLYGKEIPVQVNQGLYLGVLGLRARRPQAEMAWQPAGYSGQT